MKQVIICQNRTCRKQGSAKVLAAFQDLQLADFNVISASCLGKCGNGPMVLILPDQVWYSRVHPDEVSILIKQHL